MTRRKVVNSSSNTVALSRKVAYYIFSRSPALHDYGTVLSTQADAGCLLRSLDEGVRSAKSDKQPFVSYSASRVNEGTARKCPLEIL